MTRSENFILDFTHIYKVQVLLMIYMKEQIQLLKIKI